VVDELERNGHNLQHFARELARYLRNLLVARIAGSDTRLIAASPAQRQRLAEIAARFSEEDLTRYLSLSLDLFRDLQSSLQPRFHLEIGLVRLVQAGRLLPIEEALAGLATDPNPPSPAPRPPVPPAPVRTGPSPFEMDRAKKAAARPPEPQNSGANALAPQPDPVPIAAGDPRERLFRLLHQQNHAHLADAVEHAAIDVVGGDLNVAAPKSYGLYFRDRAFEDAVREAFGRPLRVKFTPGEAASPSEAPVAAPAAIADDTTGRALSNPEVQRFREVLGGEVRKVRNLKE